jgi:hypothetical protein
MPIPTKDTWESPMFSLAAEQIGSWLTISASVDAPRSVEFSWMNERGVFYSTTVELKNDVTGLFNVNLANRKYWKGRVHQFRLRVLPDSESKAAVTFQSVAVSHHPQGPANIDVTFCGIEDAIVRAGYETAFFLDLVNCGGEDAPALTFDSMKLPGGVSLIATKNQQTIEPLKSGERRRMLFPMKVDRPVEGTISLNLSAREEATLQGVPVEIPISVLPSLNLTKGEGVKKLLDLSREMARNAGLKGIYFMAMKWPEASTSAAAIQWLADAGFEMTSIYHFMDDGGKAVSRRKFNFDLVVDASKPFWERRHQTGIPHDTRMRAGGWPAR